METLIFPKIFWKFPEKTTGSVEVAFVEKLSDYYLTQLNTIPTRGKNVLDLVITSIENQVDNIHVLSRAESGLFTDHSTIVFDLKTSIKAPPKVERVILDYRRGDFDGLRAALDAINLTCAFQPDDINSSWLLWKDMFLAAVHDHIPSKKIKGRNSPPWMNGDIIYALRKKEAVRRKLRKSPTEALKAKFKEMRANIKVDRR